MVLNSDPNGLNEQLSYTNKNKSLIKYEIKKIFDVDRKNKISDAKFSLIPHPRFINEMIKEIETYKKNFSKATGLGF